MRGSLNFIGRTFQLVGLLVLPSALWITEVERNEARALGALFGGVLIFFVGWILTKTR
jgi:hypothetical protein